MSMASLILKRSSPYAIRSVIDSLRIPTSSRAYASVAVGSDMVSAAQDVSLQKARTWDEGVSSNFATTPVKDIFKVPSLLFHFLIGFLISFHFIFFLK